MDHRKTHWNQSVDRESRRWRTEDLTVNQRPNAFQKDFCNIWNSLLRIRRIRDKLSKEIFDHWPRPIKKSTIQIVRLECNLLTLFYTRLHCHRLSRDWSPGAYCTASGAQASAMLSVTLASHGLRYRPDRSLCLFLPDMRSSTHRCVPRAVAIQVCVHVKIIDSSHPSQ